MIAVTATGCSNRIGMPEPGTQEGDRIIDLWRVLFFTAAAVGGLVLVLLTWCLLRYRHRGHPDDDNDLPSQRRGNVPLEVVYTLVPLVIVVVIFILSVRTDPATARNDKGGRPLAVDVTAFRWQWRFDYPAQGVSVVGGPEDSPDLVLPTGRPVRLRVRSPDVIHSFFVPGFLGKMDVVPGLDNEFDLHPTRPGRYQGYCAEFCGLDHARMTFAVRVVPPDEFTRWARETAAAAPTASTGPGRP
ncbi:MAG: cytochrome c oxidase subunit II [Actinomycetota bacterium]|nr:cytochrome c oxidase subunit II [Actinomycetota bacterium]